MKGQQAGPETIRAPMMWASMLAHKKPWFRTHCMQQRVANNQFAVKSASKLANSTLNATD